MPCFVRSMYPASPKLSHLHANQAIRGLEKLRTTYGCLCQLDSDGGTFKGHDVQDRAKEHDIEQRPHLPCYLQATGLRERKDGIVKQQIKLLTSKATVAGRTKEGALC